MARYGREMVEQLLAESAIPARIRARPIPERYRVPNEDSRAAVRAGRFRPGRRTCEPKLVEIQGFPSLYAYQPVHGRSATARRTDRSQTLSALPGGMTPASTTRCCGDAIVGGHDPENVVLTGDRPVASEDAARFPASPKRSSACAPSTSAHLRKRGQPALLRRDGTPVHRASTTAPSSTNWSGKQHRTAVRFPRRSRCGMGRASELVLPAEQVFAALPAPSAPCRGRSSWIDVEPRGTSRATTC